MVEGFQPKRLLAATDLSESNVAALRYARLLSERFRTTLTVMYSDPIVYPIGAVGDVAPLLALSTPEHQARLHIDVAEHVDPILRGVPYEVFVTIGTPATTIVRAAEEKKADLLVIGTHGHHGWRRALLGSVAESVLHTANCPVLTVNARNPLPAHGPAAITRIVCPTNFTGVARESLGIAGGEVGLHERDHLRRTRPGTCRKKNGVASALDAGRFTLAGKRCALSSMTATMTAKAGRLLMITWRRMALTPCAIARPTLLVIDKSGQVRMRHVGFAESEDLERTSLDKIDAPR